ncbi:MAG TPA: hypothetical protein VMW23_02350 [Sedimentisphaerales bacterium]|nr:hypothetical protein [Sedimentisphaerales bacterium]
MGLMDFFRSTIGKWFRFGRKRKPQEVYNWPTDVHTGPSQQGSGNQIQVSAAQQIDRTQSLEKLQKGFEELITQLRNINEHLDKQIVHHEDLTGRINDGFGRFNQTLEKLDAGTTEQTDTIKHMSEILTAEGKYIKALMTRQTRRTAWMLVTFVILCVLIVLTTVFTIIYLK